MIKRKKVLHVLKSDSFSGAENVVITICRKLNTEYDFAYASVKGAIEKWLHKNQIRYYPMSRFAAAELKEIVREYRPDIIHAHDFSASVLSVCCGGKTRIISHLHNNPPWIMRWNIKSVLYLLIRSKLSRILLVSEAIQNEAVFLGKRDRKIVLMGNPVDDAYIRRMAESYAADNYDILFLGRLTRQKNPQRFIRIIREIRRQGTDVKAVMAGAGDLAGECRQLIKESGLENNITLAGFCENPYPYIKHSRMLLITSDWEGYGLVAVEALILNVPVIAYRAGGLTAVLSRYPEALCDSEQEICDKAIKLLKDRKYYDEFKNHIINNRNKLKNIDTYMEHMSSIYRELTQ